MKIELTKKEVELIYDLLDGQRITQEVYYEEMIKENYSYFHPKECFNEERVDEEIKRLKQLLKKIVHHL